MKFVIIGLTTASIVIGTINGKISDVSNAALTECTNAVALAVSLCGTMCLWSGIMNIAEKSGAVSFLEKLLYPLLSRIFKGIQKDGRAMRYIVLNIASNMMGLGNAATPTGISAMKALKEEEKADATATDNMIIFTVLNTASLQLFPATVIAIRAKYGSGSPSEILPCVWLVSIICLGVSLAAAKIGVSFRKRGKNEF